MFLKNFDTMMIIIFNRYVKYFYNFEFIWKTNFNKLIVKILLCCDLNESIKYINTIGTRNNYIFQ